MTSAIISALPRVLPILFKTVYEFSPAAREAWAAGKYIQVVTKTGKVLPILRDAATGRFVEVAAAGVKFAGGSVICMADAVFGAIETGILSHQMDKGFQKTYEEIAVVQEGITVLQQGMDVLQSSVGVLQASTALIGVGVASNLALSAVSLQQILKLREDVRLARVEIKDGFLDLKQVLGNQGAEIIQKIDEVASDIKFQHQKLMMAQAYGQFRQALGLMKNAIKCDLSVRGDTLGHARGLLANALATYSSPELFADVSSALAYLRRLECIWAMEQSLTMTFQLQNQGDAVKQRLTDLQYKIQRDVLNTIELCKSEEELAVLFPELARIARYDLPILQIWEGEIEWIQTLSQDEMQMLETIDVTKVESPDYSSNEDIAELPEQILYTDLSRASHFESLRDQLRFMVKPDMRKEYEIVINERSQQAGLNGLSQFSLESVSDQAITNLYWHLQPTT
jgi:hypothetical protein